MPVAELKWADTDLWHVRAKMDLLLLIARRNVMMPQGQKMKHPGSNEKIPHVTSYIGAD
jgi:hypothetical protein